MYWIVEGHEVCVKYKLGCGGTRSVREVQTRRVLRGTWWWTRGCRSNVNESGARRRCDSQHCRKGVALRIDHSLFCVCDPSWKKWRNLELGRAERNARKKGEKLDLDAWWSSRTLHMANLIAVYRSLEKLLECEELQELYE